MSQKSLLFGYIRLREHSPHLERTTSAQKLHVYIQELTKENMSWGVEKFWRLAGRKTCILSQSILIIWRLRRKLRYLRKTLTTQLRRGVLFIYAPPGKRHVTRKRARLPHRSHSGTPTNASHHSAKPTSQASITSLIASALFLNFPSSSLLNPISTPLTTPSLPSTTGKLRQTPNSSCQLLTQTASLSSNRILLQSLATTPPIP